MILPRTPLRVAAIVVLAIVTASCGGTTTIG